MKLYFRNGQIFFSFLSNNMKRTIIVLYCITGKPLWLGKVTTIICFSASFGYYIANYKLLKVSYFIMYLRPRLFTMCINNAMHTKNDNKALAGGWPIFEVIRLGLLNQSVHCHCNVFKFDNVFIKILWAEKEHHLLAEMWLIITNVRFKNANLIGQGQPRIIIWTHLVGPASSMLHTKSKGHRPSGSIWRRFLKGFYHRIYWAWRPSLSCDQDHLNKL